MARATVETDGLDWDDFRALEYFSIIYDIAIDEEKYNPKWCLLKPPSGFKRFETRRKGPGEPTKPWGTRRYFLFPDPEEKSPGDLPDVTISASFASSQLPFLRGLKLPEKLGSGKLAFPALRCESEDEVSRLWRKLLLAKNVRAKLQKFGSTPALDALDKLGIALLRAMPLLKREVGFAKLSRLEVQLLILKVLFLNEAAACYRGYQSISLSDDCLNLIKEVFKKGKTPYELVALYNKAQGHLHVRTYYDALRLFKEVNKEAADKENNYFHFVTSNYRHLYWPGQEMVFDAYVCYPSVLQSAETLLNLQRSWEGETLLAGGTLPGPLTAYQRARRQILLARIENDRSLSPSAPDWPQDGVEPDNLFLQRRAVDIERSLSKCQSKAAEAINIWRTNKQSDAMDLIKPSLVEFGSCTDVLRAQMQLASKNRSQIDEGCLAWAGGLAVCKSLLSFAISDGVSDKCRNEVLREVDDYFKLHTNKVVFHDVSVSLCIDKVYRDHAVAVRKTLIKHLHDIHDLGRPEEVPAVFSNLFEQFDACFKALLDKLISEKPRAASGIEICRWREQRALLCSAPLLPELDDPSAFHKELREFISFGFVHPIDHDGSLESTTAWKECTTQHRCVVESGKPTKCGGERLESNSSFIRAESGSKTLHHLDRLVQKNRSTIEQRLYEQRKHDPGWHFVVLQRWNSFTPAMSASDGGGYFLFHVSKDSNSTKVRGAIDLGVVIDPGYGFVKNFVAEGFGVLDITAIVITHDHPDHLADVGSLVHLLFEARKNRGGAARMVPKIEMLLSRGAFERLNPLIESSRDVFRDTVVLEPESEIDYYDVGKMDNPELMLRLYACRALHRDSSHLLHREGFDAVGIIGEIRDASETVRRIGIPSDTKWDKVISRVFTENPPCDLICLHLGSIVPEKFRLISYFDERETSVKVLHEKDHLYLPGVVRYLEAIRQRPANETPVMVILSEFGEELAGGVRIDIARRLQAYTEEKEKGKVVVLPGDVGLRVDPMAHTIRCSCCHLEHPWTTPFSCETSGSSEQIFYVCPWCLRNFTQQERAEVFSDRHTALLEFKS